MEQKKNKKQIGLYILYGAVTVFILALILSFNDIEEIFGVLGTADFGYVLLAFLCIAIYMALYPLSLCILTKARGCDIKMGKTYSIAMTEHFFNGITPFATGGQPFQAYEFSKAKVKVSESTSLLLMNFIVFMLVTNGFAACSLFYFTRFVTTTPIKILAIIGFSMNFIVLLCMIGIATNKRVRRLFSGILNLLCRIKWLGKFLKPKTESLNEYFVQVQEAFSNLMKKKGAFLLSIGAKILSMGAYYAATFFILRALHINAPWSDFFFIMCGTSFAITMVVFVPTPGSSGGIEFAFKSIFSSIAAGAAAAVSYGGMLIWRLLSYYLVMLISLAFYIILEISNTKASKKGERTDE